jgi:O-Antigen ligase
VGKTGLLPRPAHAKPSGKPVGIAHAHEPQAYSADSSGLSLSVGLVAVAVFLWWETQEGGYAPTAWYPGAAVFLILFIAVLTLSASRWGLPSGWSKWGLLSFAALTAWSFLSIVWAGVRGDAWDGANRTLLYLTVYGTFALLRWRARDAGVLLALFALGTAAIGTAVLATEDAGAFIDGRLASPTGYANANAALFLIAFWPAVSLAALPELHWAARSLLLAIGGLLLQLAVLAQSRGSVVAGAVALAVYLLLSERRLRVALVLVPVAAVTLASLDPLLSVFASSTEIGFREAVAREQQALAFSTAALLAVGAAIGVVDRRGSVDRRRHRQERRRILAPLAVGGVLVALVAAAMGIGLSFMSGPAEGSAPSSALGSSRFGGLETGRLDMWRVAGETVAEHPLLGVGVDNFAVDFARERRTHEEPLYPHSLVLRAFSQTGLVGGILFLAFITAALVAALRSRARSGGLANAIAAASIASAVYWLVHGSLDWLWEIPVLTAPALALLGLACGLGQTRLDRPLWLRLRSLPVRCATGLLAAAALCSFLLPGLAAWELERAVAAWPAEPEQAFSRLDRAHRLNPLSERADVLAGTLAQRATQSGRARVAFEATLDRNPADWYAHLQLALLNAAAGRRSQALADLSRAEALNPLEPTIQAARNHLFTGRPVPEELILRLDRLAVRSPLGRRPVDCRPVSGIASSCVWSRMP